MKIRFCGAARCVTGSMFLLETESLNILIDCGLAQGEDEKKAGDSFPFSASMIDAVLLTHAHIDHIGKLPFLFSKGFNGKIYCTEDTKKIMSLALQDSYRIACDNAKQNSSSILYTKEDVSTVIDLTRGISFSETIQVDNNIST